MVNKDNPQEKSNMPFWYTYIYATVYVIVAFSIFGLAYTAYLAMYSFGQLVPRVAVQQ